jgi:hypothetical protein
VACCERYEPPLLLPVRLYTQIYYWKAPHRATMPHESAPLPYHSSTVQAGPPGYSIHIYPNFLAVLNFWCAGHHAVVRP